MMDLLKQLKLYLWLMLMLFLFIQSAQPKVLIRFDRAPLPRTRFSSAVFHYSILGFNGSDGPCKASHGCSIHCQLDGKPLIHCPLGGRITFKRLTANEDHIFLLNITTMDGDRNSASYKWFIDTIAPTASITSENSYTNAEKTAIDIKFSEACRGSGGFKCINSSSCDVLVNGPAYVDASTLQEVEPYVKYRVIIAFSMRSTYGRVIITMAANSCTDRAGNQFIRTDSSLIVVHFDRRPVKADLWTSVPAYELKINEVPRTVITTNKMKDLGIFLDFSDPVVNTTEDIQSVISVNVGELVPIRIKNHNSRRFVFKLTNVTRTEVIMVKLQSASIIGRAGTPAESVSPISFLYDLTRPGVRLRTRFTEVTRESHINVIVEFTEPVFGFQPAQIEVVGGSITRFEELTNALYSLIVLGTSQPVISVLVPEGIVNDVTGNLNMASNRLEVRQDSSPTVSVALHSFITAGLLSTSLAAITLKLSSTNLAAIGASTSGSTNIAVSDPSMNLLGMVGHLQVFVLSEWMGVRLPIEYSETAKGLRWLIPRAELPWRKGNSANYYFPSEGRNDLSPSPGNLSIELPSLFDRASHHSMKINSSNFDSYGRPLNSTEYTAYFMKEEPSAASIVMRVEIYTGWEDLQKNLFWLGIGGASLFVGHLLILLLLSWRTGKSIHWMLSFPRFEVFLLILMLPCISQSSAFIIRGGTTRGIIIGALLLAIPAALILSISLFFIVAIFNRSFVQYKEIIHTDTSEPWPSKMMSLVIGMPTTGKWFYREGLPSSFLPRFGFLFEDRKGPPVYVSVNQNNTNSVPKWVDSGQSGIGRMRVAGSDGKSEDPKLSTSAKLAGCARSAYLILDLIRRVALGFISAVYSSQRLSQSIIALSMTLVQFLYLFTLKPYIRRGVHVVESISLLCEAAIFGFFIYTSYRDSFGEKNKGILMLVLLFISFFTQLLNEWYALIKCILRLSQSKRPSLKVGLKYVTKGIILPFLPKKHWSRLLPGSSQPKTGLVPVPPLSQVTDLERENGSGRVNPLRAMTATVVPMQSPDSPNMTSTQATASTNAQTSTRQKLGGEKRLKGTEMETNCEVKKLRELARASFSGSPVTEEGGSSSFLQDSNVYPTGSSADILQLGSPNNRY